MKTILAIYTLCTSVAFAAEVAPPDDFAVEEDAESPVLADEHLQRAREQVDRIKQQAGHIAAQAATKAKDALKHVEGAWAEAGDDAVRFFSDLQGEDSSFFTVAAPGSATGQALIVRTKEVEAATLDDLQEDLAVMSRILSKSLGRDAGDSAMGIMLSALPGSRRPQSVYLEGYGALFLVHVKFPLAPAPSVSDETPERATDSTWEETRRELFGQKTGPVRIWNFTPGGNMVEYDADRVEDLKKELLEALKNASNIRALKPDESVTLVVLGNQSAGPGPRRVQALKSRAGATAGGRKVEIIRAASGPKESTMTIRVKKSDVDAFANGSIDAAEFAKRAAIATY